MSTHHRVVLVALPLLAGCASPPPLADGVVVTPPLSTDSSVSSTRVPVEMPAVVNVCHGLTLYGNAAAAGVCQTLSPGTQNLWVCELTGSDPDVHTTFSATTALHVTVRTPPGNPTCEGNSTLDGVWPNPPAAHALRIAAGQPATVCKVGIQNWVARLNAVQSTAPGAGGTFCRAGFLAAQVSGRLSPAVVTSYVNLCNYHHCP